MGGGSGIESVLLHGIAEYRNATGPEVRSTKLRIVWRSMICTVRAPVTSTLHRSSQLY